MRSVTAAQYRAEIAGKAKGKPQRQRAVRRKLDLEACRSWAYHALAEPPKHDWIEREEPVGWFVAEWYLPLWVCEPVNRLARAGAASQWWLHDELKKACFAEMRKQLAEQLRDLSRFPLKTRAHVRCIRFSATECDPESGWSKNPIDRLRVGGNGLGLILDDKARHLRRSVWWEPGPRNGGFVLVELFDGVE